MELQNFSPFFIALGWSLLHTLWQAGLLWVIYLTLTRSGTRYSSVWRHNLALILNLSILILFGFNLYFEYSFGTIFQFAYGETWIVTRALPSYLHFFQTVLPWLSAFYLMSVLVLLLRFTRQYYYIKKIRTSDRYNMPASFKIYLENTRSILGIVKPVEIWISHNIQTPQTIGFWKPLILIPVSAINQLSVAQTEAVILHELQHIRRNDYLLNLLLTITDLLLFFNPFCRYFTEVIQREREHDCDDLVLQFQHHPETYAAALLQLEKNRSIGSISLALEATGSRSFLLLHRIKRILTGKIEPLQKNRNGYAWLFLSFVFLLTGLLSNSSFLAEKNFSAQDQFFIKPQLPITVSSNSSFRVQQPGFRTGPRKDLLVAKESYYIPEYLETGEGEEINPLANEVAMDPNRLNRDYALASGSLAPGFAIQSSQMEGPFIPDNSFRYQFMQDTSRPQQKDPGPAELKALIEKNKTMQALESINWIELERSLKAQGLSQLDMEKIQAEIKKSLEQLDWKKIEEDAQRKLKLAQLELQLKQNYLDQLQKYHEAKAIKDKQKQMAEELILQEHFNQNESLRKIQEKKVIDSIRAKRIIII